MIRFRDAPIKHKLMLVVVVASSFALMMMAGAVIGYELLTFRKSITRNTNVLAQLVGSKSTSALAFENQEDANERLSVLSAVPHITAAAVYDGAGHVFAKFPANIDSSEIPPVPGTDGSFFKSSHLITFQPILEKGDRVGTLYLRANLRQMYNRLLAYGALIIAAGIVAVVGAVTVSTFLQRLISRPIVELAKVARAVSEQQDYSVRALRHGHDEIGDLTDAFNQMLTRIGETTNALAESEERRRRALEGSETGTWEFDLLARHVTWDARMFRLFGLEGTTWKGTEEEMYASIHPDDRAVVQTQIDSAIANRRDLNVEFRINGGDGRIRHIATRGRVFYDTHGIPIRMSGVSMDVTAAKETEKALQNAMNAAEAANRAKDEFLAILSHELRTPLTPVLTTLAMLDEDASTPPQLHRELEMIRRNVEVEARLIDDLLDVTRIARGKLELHRQTLDLRVLLNHAVRSYLETPAAQKDLSTVVDVEPGASTHILADASRITQVLWNLLGNAYKFTPAGGSIRVRVFNESGTTADRQGEPDLIIAISDTGIGIEPDIRPRIFDAFEQGDPSRTRLFGGLGLGLAISRAIVELHGGTLTAESAGRNSGATFTIRLPTVPTPLPEVTPPRIPSDSQQPHPGDRATRVLLVEDHIDTAQQLARLLSRAGHHVMCAGSLAEARDLAAHHPFDLLLSDLGLPDGSGHELMREFASRYRMVGVALSGYGMEADVRESLAAGFARHLTKPVNWADLKATIQVITAPTTGSPAGESATALPTTNGGSGLDLAVSTLNSQQ